MEGVLVENKAELDDLTKHVALAGVIPFVGAGMSQPYYSQWSKFLLDQAKDQQILTHVRAQLRRNQYEEAAELLFATLKDHRFQEICQKAFGPEKLPPAKDIPGSLRDVVALGQGPVITLNFDPVLDFVFRECGAPFEDEIWGVQVDRFNRALDLNLHYLVKVHGHYADRTARILTHMDYETAYEGDSRKGTKGSLLRMLLANAFQHGRLLFLGCSLNQDRWVDILREVHETGSKPHVGWAVLERPPSARASVAREQFLSARGITPIWYAKGDYGCVEVILRHVVAKAARARAVVRAGWAEIADRTDALIEEAGSLLAGREAVLEALDEYAAADSGKPLVVYAPAGFGKTALLSRWAADQRRNGRAVAFHFFSEHRGLTSRADAWLNLLRQIDEIFGKPKHRKRGSPEAELRSELYQVLKDRDGSDVQHLTILIDALDECEGVFDPPFPLPLPAGVRVIISARGSKEEVEERLPGWTRDYQPLPLSGLPRPVIHDWLRRAGNGELAGLATDDEFAEKLWTKTEGFPLYLKHLIEELARVTRQGGDARAVFEATPKGFSEYVKDRAKRLKLSEALGEPRNQMVLAVLAVAVAMLPEKDLAAVLPHTSRIDLERLPWTLTRWFSIRSDAGGALDYGFTHPLLAREFRAELRGLPDDAERLLLDHCSQWRKHGSSYALRHYPAQLFEANRWDQLFALARDTAFEQAQRGFTPDEPDLPLRTVQLALKGAAKSGNTAAAAEFLLLHAIRRNQFLVESPLDALRNGDLKHACRLADLHDLETCTLWRLLLAWEAAAKDRPTEARTILSELGQKKLGQLSSWKEKYAAAILSELVDLDEATCIGLQSRLLADNARASLCGQLVRRGHLPAARKIAQSFLFVHYGRAWVEAAMALEHAARHEFDQALRALDEVLALRAQFRPGSVTFDNMTVNSHFSDLVVHTIGEIAAAQASSGAIESARQTLERIANPEYRVPGLCGIATALHRSGNNESGKQFLAEAYAITEQQSSEWSIDKAARALSEAQANLGFFREAVETTWKIDDDQRQYALAVIAGVQAQAGDPASARKIAEEMTDTAAREDLLKAIAAGSARAGEFGAAQETADAITGLRTHDEALMEIAGIQAAAGKFHEAFATVERRRGSWWVDCEDGLLEIALGQARAGDAQEARGTMARAIIRSSDRLPDAALDEPFVEIAAALAGSKDWPAAEAAVEKIGDAYRRVNALRAIAQEQFRSERPELARLTVASAILVAGNAGKLKEDLLCQIARTQAEAGEFEPALETMKLVHDPYSLVRGLGCIGVAAALAGNQARAEEIFADARRAIANVEGIQEAAWRDLARYFLRARKLAAAAEIILEIGAMGRRAAPDALGEGHIHLVSAITNQADTLREVVRAHVEAGLHDEARAAIAGVDEFLNDLRKLSAPLSSLQGRILEAVAASQAVIGDFEAAFGTVAEIGGFRWRASSKARALKDIGEAQAAHGHVEAARETLASALSAARSYQKQDVFDSEKAIGEIAEACARMGDIEAARKAAQCISEPSRKAPTLNHIAIILAGRAGKQASAPFFAEAAACAETIQESSPRSNTMTDIAVGEASSGFGDAAVRAAARILTSRPGQLSRIAEALLAARDIDHFKELLVPCAEDPQSALKMCGMLVRLDPQAAAAVGDVVERALPRGEFKNGV